jgi:hypothetical protein
VVPPRDPFATLALDGPTGPADETAGPPLTLLYLEHAVTAAAANGGGWVQVVFHRICASGAPDLATCMAGESPIEDTTFSAWLDWLQRGAPAGTTVRTVRQVVAPDR